jgi:hypothetical protein
VLLEQGKQKVSKTFVGGERRFWKSFEKMAVCSHACKEKTKDNGKTLGKKTKVGL